MPAPLEGPVPAIILRIGVGDEEGGCSPDRRGRGSAGTPVGEDPDNVRPFGAHNLHPLQVYASMDGQSGAPGPRRWTITDARKSWPPPAATEPGIGLGSGPRREMGRTRIPGPKGLGVRESWLGEQRIAS